MCQNEYLLYFWPYGVDDMDEDELCHDPKCRVCVAFRAEKRANAKAAAATPKPVYEGRATTYVGMAVGGPQNGKILNNTALTILLYAPNGHTTQRYDYDQDKKQWVFFSKD